MNTLVAMLLQFPTINPFKLRPLCSCFCQCIVSNLSFHLSGILNYHARIFSLQQMSFHSSLRPNLKQIDFQYFLMCRKCTYQGFVFTMAFFQLFFSFQTCVVWKREGYLVSFVNKRDLWVITIILSRLLIAVFPMLSARLSLLFTKWFHYTSAFSFSYRFTAYCIFLFFYPV